MIKNTVMTSKIVLKTDTFLYHDGEKGLLYNCKESSFCFFDVRNKAIRSAVEQWEDIGNLYTAKIEYSNDDTAFLSFLSQIEDKKLGTVVSGAEEAPLSFPPVLRIKRSIDNLPAWFEGTTGSLPVSHYLKRLIVHLGGETAASSSTKLNIDSFLSFISRIDKQALNSMTLIISEWDNAQITACANNLTELKDIVRFSFFAPDPSFKNDILDKLAVDGYAITQECPSDTSIEIVSWEPGRSYQLLVRSEEEVEHWETLLQGAENVNYDFKPVADDNLDFFRKNIFLTEEEILSQKLTKKDIFRHQALNVNQFGTLYVFPDGTLHPAMDAPAIGTLGESVHKIVIRELEQNYAWRQTRRLMEPCKNCLYHDLCPSPSVYERIFGVPGCTYWQK